jgi:uncharacterized protein YbbC (DUF1343 family)
MDIVRGKRVAIVTNHTARVANGQHLVDALLQRGVTVKRLFGPEHGIRGVAAPGEQILDTLDVKTGVPVVSLYGKINKPSPAMLADIDVLLYDIQDVGARFYTYISTMALCMEAAAERGIPFVVLDRPDPLGGTSVDGPLLEDSLRSFVGIAPIPVVYGLTSGELARLLAGEGMLAGAPDLIVVPMKSWHRDMRWKETGLPWIAPSPNMPSPETAIVYPATCFLEATNLSEGRGTRSPFQILGAPFVDGARLAGALTELALPGVEFDSISFTPFTSKHAGVLCHGVLLKVTDPGRFEPVTTGLHILREVEKLHPRDFKLKRRWFVRLMGSAAVYDRFAKGEETNTIRSSWIEETRKFNDMREKYFLYR